MKCTACNAFAYQAPAECACAALRNQDGGRENDEYLVLGWFWSSFITSGTLDTELIATQCDPAVTDFCPSYMRGQSLGNGRYLPRVPAVIANCTGVQSVTNQTAESMRSNADWLTYRFPAGYQFTLVVLFYSFCSLPSRREKLCFAFYYFHKTWETSLRVFLRL
jgi:hypothetical protein